MSLVKNALKEFSENADGSAISKESLKIINSVLVLEEQPMIPADAFIISVWEERDFIYIDFEDENGVGDIVCFDKVFLNT